MSVCKVEFLRPELLCIYYGFTLVDDPLVKRQGTAAIRGSPTLE